MVGFLYRFFRFTFLILPLSQSKQFRTITSDREHSSNTTYLKIKSVILTNTGIEFEFSWSKISPETKENKILIKVMNLLKIT